MRFFASQQVKMCHHPERKRKKSRSSSFSSVKQTVVWLKYALENISLFVFEYVKKVREHVVA